MDTTPTLDDNSDDDCIMLEYDGDLKPIQLKFEPKYESEDELNLEFPQTFSPDPNATM